ncbi:TPA: stress response small protein YobI, partial [Escherichia coli]|nr:stress response small protein YobI [Escherichia coli]MCE4451761.1 stress response small protein YobI [Escherichia coli]HBQ4402102.1 stress response small protein YobI [Escherichia coli]HCL9820586.1 stress response small protein YobI [Escherichia coli]HEA1435739.1 stress response small protein YobI [Escherichia coli]
FFTEYVILKYLLPK